MGVCCAPSPFKKNKGKGRCVTHAEAWDKETKYETDKKEQEGAAPAKKAGDGVMAGIMGRAKKMVGAQTTKAVPEQPSGLCAAKWKGGQICCEKSNGDFSCYTEAKCGQKYGTVEKDETKCV